MDDYQPLIIPSQLKRLIEGHKANIKCIDTLGPGSYLVISGSRSVYYLTIQIRSLMSSDATLRISNTSTGVVQHILTGHTSRIWDCASSPTYDAIASASGDGSIRIWSPTGECKGVLYGDGGDVYSLSWRPSGVCPFSLSLIHFATVRRRRLVLMSRIKLLQQPTIGYYGSGTWSQASKYEHSQATLNQL